jgi:hypothetical protein
MNDSLQYVRPIMSLDAAQHKSTNKGTLSLATVKTGLNEIYTVAFAIGREHEGYHGWNYF